MPQRSIFAGVLLNVQNPTATKTTKNNKKSKYAPIEFGRKHNSIQVTRSESFFMTLHHDQPNLHRSVCLSLHLYLYFILFFSNFRHDFAVFVCAIFRFIRILYRSMNISSTNDFESLALEEPNAKMEKNRNIFQRK